MADVMISTTITSTNVTESLCSPDPISEDIPDEALPQNGDMDSPAERSALMGASEMESSPTTTIPMEIEAETKTAERANETELPTTNNRGPNNNTNMLLPDDERADDGTKVSLSNGIKRTLAESLSGDGEFDSNGTLGQDETEGAGEAVLKRRRTITDSQDVLTNGTHRPLTPDVIITTIKEELPLFAGDTVQDSCKDADKEKEEEEERVGEEMVESDVTEGPNCVVETEEVLNGEKKLEKVEVADPEQESLKPDEDIPEANSCEMATTGKVEAECGESLNTVKESSAEEENTENKTTGTMENTVETSNTDGDENEDSELNLVLLDDETRENGNTGEEINEDELLADSMETENFDSKKDIVQSEETADQNSEPAIEKIDENVPLPEPATAADDDEVNSCDIAEELDNQDAPLVLQISSESEEQLQSCDELAEDNDNESTHTGIVSGETLMANMPREELTEGNEKPVHNDPLRDEETVKLSNTREVLEIFDEPKCKDLPLADTTVAIAVPIQVNDLVKVPAASSEDIINFNSKPPAKETRSATISPSRSPSPVYDLVENESKVEMMDLELEQAHVSKNDKNIHSTSNAPSPAISLQPDSVSTLAAAVAKKSSSVTLQALTKLKSSFKTFTREDLEALIMEKMVEAILFKSKAADNAQKIVLQEQQMAKMREKLEECKRQFKTVEMLFNNASEEVRQHEKKGCKVLPKPILRTVGIQSQTVHQLRCKTCGSKTITANMAKPTDSTTDNSVASMGMGMGMECSRLLEAPIIPTGTSRVEQLNNIIKPPQGTTITAVPRAKPLKPILNKQVNTAEKVEKKTAAVQQMVVDLTEDDEVPVQPKPSPAVIQKVIPTPTPVQRVILPAPKVSSAAPKVSPPAAPKLYPPVQKPVNNVQRNMSISTAVPPLVSVSKPSFPVPPLRTSLPAPIPTQTIKRGECACVCVIVINNSYLCASI